MSFENPQMIGGPMSGSPPPQVVCEPVPIPKDGTLKCRRGQGSRTFQGQKPPTCDGFVKPAGGNWQGVMFACEKCRLLHTTVNKDGVMHYGAVL